MKSICFFPFTRMNQTQAQTMDAFFRDFKVLNLDPDNLAEPHCSSLVKSGRLKVVSAGEEKAALLDAKVAAFRNWAELHKGNERNLKALIREKTWLQDDTGVAALQSQIRRGQGGAPSPEENTGREDDPLLYLRFAEILDAETESIRQGLQALDANNEALFAELKGEIGDTQDNQAPESLQSEQPESLRGVEDRIRAWCAAAGRTNIFDCGDENLVLVTTNRAVSDSLEGNSFRVINELDIDSIKVHEHGCPLREGWQQMVDQILDDIISGEKPSLVHRPDDTECSCPKGRIRISHFPDGDLNKDFNIPGRQVFVCLVELNS